MKLFRWGKKATEEEGNVPSISNPHIVLIKNTTKKTQDFVLFGSNMHLNQPNFGNKEGIELTYLSESVPYASVLSEMLTTSYTIKLMRVQSNNVKNIRQTLSWNKYNSNVGMFDVVFTRREIKLSIMMDAYQFQSDILDVSLPRLEMDKYHYIFGRIEPESELVISLFPVVVDTTQYDSVRLSGKNVAPVIIHTTPRMKRMLNGGKTFFNKLKNLFKRKNK